MDLSRILTKQPDFLVTDDQALEQVRGSLGACEVERIDIFGELPRDLVLLRAQLVEHEVLIDEIYLVGTDERIVGDRFKRPAAGVNGRCDPRYEVALTRDARDQH